MSALALAGLWSISLAFAVAGVLQTAEASMQPGNATSMLVMSATFAVYGLLLLPSAVFSLAHLLGRRIISNPLPAMRLWKPGLLVLALPFVLYLGQWSVNNPNLSWLILPPMHILAVGLPVLWLLNTGVRRLSLGSPQRIWGVFGSGIALGPALMLPAEGIVALFFLVATSLGIANQPGFIQEIIGTQDLTNLPNLDPEMLVEMIAPLLLRPSVIIPVLIYFAVIIPLIEELLKPVGVWLLAGRNISATEGFTAGLLSGAGYALFESLAASSGGGSWLLIVVTRIGTAVIHIFTAGLTGWALALAWRKGRFLVLGLSYLAAVLVHGLWNGLTLLTSLSAIDSALNTPVNLPWLTRLGEAGPYGLVCLAVGALLGLLWSNRRMVNRARQGSLKLHLEIAHTPEEAGPPNEAAP